MAEVPGTMIAIDPAEPGGPEVLRPVERPVPCPGPGELLIRVVAAGVNRPDVLQRLGRYPMPPGTSSILGLEVAGEVVMLGEGVTRWRIGDRTCALLAGGGYAEYAVAPEGQCLPVPEGLSLVEAASLPETYFTVWSNLFERAYADEGDRLLVHGGASGIGTTAVQLAKAFGLTVYATAGSPEKCAAVHALGADLVIDYKSQDFVAEVMQATDGRGVDIVLDMVGGDYVPRNLACLADNGRHVSIAVLRGARAEINIAQIMQKRLTLTGSMLRPRSVGFKSAIAASLEHAVWPLFSEGRLKPVIDSRFPLEAAAEAHQRMEAGLHVGKIVLDVR